MSDYDVITQHGTEREVRAIGFDDYDDAVAHAEATTPDTDGTLCPNVDEVEYPGYERGIFWLGNRYAVIVTRVPS